VKIEAYPQSEYPGVEAATFPPEIHIAYAVCGRECGNREFIVDGSTQVCQSCGKLMFRTVVQKYSLSRSDGPMRKSKGTTTPGTTNKNAQLVVRPTGLQGTDHLQKVYVLRCTRCGHEYGANGSDLHLRKCPKCQGGAAGLPY
jgi:hypothetical protein